MKRLFYILLFCSLPFLSVAQRTSKIDTTIYNAVEVQPQFPGGEAAMSKYIMDHMQFKERPVDENGNIVASITVKFIVEKDGNLSNFTAVKGGSKACGEIIRILKTMPKWSPAKMDGKPVRNSLVFPIACILFSE